jgi:hypothetical protein
MKLTGISFEDLGSITLTSFALQLRLQLIQHQAAAMPRIRQVGKPVSLTEHLQANRRSAGLKQAFRSS